MAVPDFQSILKPLLKHCSDGKEHTYKDANEALAKEFNLADEEIHEREPGGKRKTFRDRTC